MNLTNGISLYIECDAVPDTELEWTASSYDRASGIDQRGVHRTTVTNDDPLELVAEPAASVYRTIATAALHNPDAATSPEIQIYMWDGVFRTTQWKGTLPSKATLYYAHGVWTVVPFA